MGLEPAGQEQQTNVRRKPSETRFPAYNLADSLAVAQVIHEKAGGAANRDQLAAFLGYGTTKSGAFNSRLAAARLFGFITTQADSLVITERAQKALMPVYAGQTQEALVEAFLAVPLFRTIYEDHRGKELPPEFGIKNLLRTRFGLTGPNIPIAYRTLMESADQAGFFATRGTRTHLIMPTPAKGTLTQPDEGQRQDAQDFPGDGGGGGDSLPPQPINMNADQVKLEYVRKLISLLGNDSVEDKKEIMDRIERLLEAE